MSMVGTAGHRQLSTLATINFYKIQFLGHLATLQVLRSHRHRESCWTAPLWVEQNLLMVEAPGMRAGACSVICTVSPRA